MRGKAEKMSRNREKKRFESKHTGKCRIRLRAVSDSSSEHDDVFMSESELKSDYRRGSHLQRMNLGYLRSNYAI